MSDPWISLRQLTQARIAQGRVGCGLPSKVLLDFQLDHAAARDAVHQPWPIDDFATQLSQSGIANLCLNSKISHRVEYLQRPDKGRCLDTKSQLTLHPFANNAYDIVLIISNGLSSTAIINHGLAFIQAILLAFQHCQLSIAPLCLVENARVALADEIGALINARLAIMVIGERPGLSAADSLGAYLTFNPKVGNSDAERNCISNIRPPEGLSYAAAASKLVYLTCQALQLGYSGVALKDDMPSDRLY